MSRSIRRFPKPVCRKSARMIGYVAGTVADKLPATVKAQTEEILGKIDALLAAAGSSNPD